MDSRASVTLPPGARFARTQVVMRPASANLSPSLHRADVTMVVRERDAGLGHGIAVNFFSPMGSTSSFMAPRARGRDPVGELIDTYDKLLRESPSLDTLSHGSISTHISDIISLLSDGLSVDFDRLYAPSVRSAIHPDFREICVHTDLNSQRTIDLSVFPWELTSTRVFVDELQSTAAPVSDLLGLGCTLSREDFDTHRSRGGGASDRDQVLARMNAYVNGGVVREQRRSPAALIIASSEHEYSEEVSVVSGILEASGVEVLVRRVDPDDKRTPIGVVQPVVREFASSGHALTLLHICGPRIGDRFIVDHASWSATGFERTSTSIFGDDVALPLVFINSCASAHRHGTALCTPYEVSNGITSSSWIEALPSVATVVTLWPVTVTVSRLFAGAFYDAICSGSVVATAMRRARNVCHRIGVITGLSIDKSSRLGDPLLSHMAYTLFGLGQVRLFDREMYGGRISEVPTMRPPGFSSDASAPKVVPDISRKRR